MRNHIIVILTVLLLISGVVIYFLIRERSIAQRDEELQLKESIAAKKHALAVIEARDAQISTLLNDRREDSVRHTKDQGRLKRNIASLKERSYGVLTFPIPQPPTMWYSKDSTKLFISGILKDSIIVLQDSLIADLENERDTLYITDNQVIDSLNRQVSDLSELFQGQLKQSMKMEGELEREKRKRWSIGPHVGYGLRGEDVGISLQYSIFRF